MNKPHQIESNRWIIFSGIIGFVIFFFIYPNISPEYRYNPDMTRDQSIQMSNSILASHGLDLNQFYIVSSLHYDHSRSIQAQMQTNRDQAMKDLSSPEIYYWSVKYTPKNRSEYMLSSGSGQAGASNKGILIATNISSEGVITFINASISDSIATATIPKDEAYTKAESFLKKYFTGRLDSLIEQGSEMKQRRTDYTFSWKAVAKDGRTCKVSIGIAGNLISQYHIDYENAAKDAESSIQQTRTAVALIIVIAYIVLGVLMVITLVRRLKNDEISFKSAWFWGIITTLVSGISFAITFSDQDIVFITWIFLLVVFLSALFRGIGMLIAWSASEATGRAVWNEKYYTLDAVQKFKFRSRWIGRSIVNGIFIGGVVLGLFTLILLILSRITPLVILLGSYSSGELGNASLLQSPLKNAASAISDIVGYMMASLTLSVFVPGIFSRFIKNKYIISIIGGLAWMMTSETLMHMIFPIYFSALFSFLIGAIITWIFLCVDLQAVFVSGFTFIMMQYGLVSVHLGTSEFIILGLGYFGCVSLLCAFGFFVSKIRANEIDLEENTPKFVKRITERQRLQLEVESARHIQLSLLPREKPSIRQLDISCVCIPALEVGGDYYDFIQFDDHRVGILIGDVSGKGISAAFYMTLAKGVIASQARRSLSPKSVLTSVNELLYEIMERGKFISMVYGVFDTAKGTLSYAHAGHNPIIHYDAAENQVHVLRSKGMALGLEKGPQFTATLDEQEISLKPNDVFVFYTDGYVEAQNKHNDEFGEEKLIETIRAMTTKSSEEIMTAANESVKQFVGKARQHDDMTMVIVKIEG